MRLLPTIVLLVLLFAGSIVALFAIAGIERQPPLVARPDITRAFSPNGDGELDTAELTFTVTRPDTIDAYIVDERQQRVSTLATGRPTHGRVSLQWDGSTDDGSPAPQGLYRPELVLRERSRSLVLPTTIRLDTTPPHVRAFATDESRLAIRALRVNATVSGASEYYVETTDEPQLRLPLIRMLRSAEDRKRTDRDRFLMSVRLTSQVLARQRGELLALRFVARDAAGNEAVREFTVRQAAR